MKNDKAALDSGVSIVLIILVTSILISSILISWFLFNIYDITIAGIAMPLLSGSQYENFVDNTVSTDVYVIGGNWTYTAGVGRTADTDNSYLLFDNVISNNNYAYTNEYHIINSLKSDYSIILEYSTNSKLEIIVKSDGFHIPDSSNGDRYFFPYPNANQVVNVDINTEYNPTNYNYPAVIFTFNGAKLFTLQTITGSQLPILKIYYGGVGAKHAGLIIQDFKSTNDRNSSDWSAFFTMASAYLSAIVKIIFWNIDSQYLPLELNLIFIKPQLIGIGICILIIIRG